MPWQCDGIPKNGKHSPRPHASFGNPDYLNECSECGLPRSAMRSDSTGSGGTSASGNVPVPIIVGSTLLLTAIGLTIAILLNRPEPITCLPEEISVSGQCVKFAPYLAEKLENFDQAVQQHLAEESPESLRNLLRSARSFQDPLEQVDDRLGTGLSSQDQEAFESLGTLVDSLVKTEPRTDPTVVSQQLISDFPDLNPDRTNPELNIIEQVKTIVIVLSRPDTTTYFRRIADVPMRNVRGMRVRYGGSTTLAPLRCDRTGNEPICLDPDNNLELRIVKAHPQFDLRYTNPLSSDENPGSGSGIRMLLDQQISFAHSSRPLKDDESKRGIEAIPIAIDGIAIYVSPEVLNNVKSLTRSQLKDIFTCKETNWRSFGGQNLSIVPISRDPEDGGTPEFFKDNVLTGEEFGACIQSDPGYIYSTTDSIRKVNTTPGAISYASASEVCNQETIPVSRELTSDPISPCIESEVNRNAFLEDVYPINRRVFVIVRKDQSLDAEAGRAYVDMVLSDEGQQLVEKAGFVSLRQL